MTFNSGGNSMAVKGKVKAKPSPLQLKPISAKQTKSQILKAISEHTGLTLKQVQMVFHHGRSSCKMPCY